MAGKGKFCQDSHTAPIFPDSGGNPLTVSLILKNRLASVPANYRVVNRPGYSKRNVLATWHPALHTVMRQLFCESAGPGLRDTWIDTPGWVLTTSDNLQTWDEVSGTTVQQGIASHTFTIPGMNTTQLFFRLEKRAVGATPAAANNAGQVGIAAPSWPIRADPLPRWSAMGPSK